MNNIVLEKTWVQGRPVQVDNLLGTTFVGEAGAHTFRVSGIDADQSAVPITGTITGKLLAANNVTVPLEGSVSDGVAELTLTEDCYVIPGRFILSIYAENDDVSLCIYCCVGNVFRTESDIVEYPSATIPDIQALIDAAQAVAAEVPVIVTAAQTAVDGIEEQKDTMIASIASVAGQGTDTTLTQSGVAADAKAAGDQVSALKSAFCKDSGYFPLSWEQGTITSSGTSDNSKFIRSPEYYPAYTGNVLEYIVASGYVMRPFAYTSANVYKGGLGDITGPAHGFLKITVADVAKVKFRVNNSSNTAVVPNEGYGNISVRLFNGDIGHVTPQMFGAVGNGINDDTAAFQSALNSGFDVYVPTSHNELYLITNTLTVPNTCKRIFGDITPHGGTYQSGQIKFDLTNTVESAADGRSVPLFELAWNTQGLTIAGIGASCVTISDSRTGMFLKATELLPANPTTETPMVDKDVELRQTYATNFYQAINFTGRGMTSVDSSITSCNYIANFNWIGDNADSNENHPKSMNQRRIQFKNCALHSITNQFFRVSSGHAYGLMITGCTADVGRGVIISSEEEAWGWEISNNVFLGMHCHTSGGTNQGAAINLSGGARDCVISNNVFAADTAFWSDGYVPVNYLYMAGAVGCTVNGNVFRKCLGDAAVIGSVSSTNVFDPETATDGYRAKVSDKSIQSNSSYTLSDFIPVVPGDVVYCNQTLGSSSYGHALYAENKTTILDVIPSNNPETSHANMTFVIPDDVYWMRLTVSASSKNTFEATVNKGINGLSISGNSFDSLPDGEYYPVHFQNNATNIAFAGNTETSGKTLYAVDSGYTVGIYSNTVG